MKKQISPIFLATFLVIAVLFSIVSCDDEIEYSGEPVTNDFRVLKAEYESRTVSGTVSSFDPEGQLDFVFSHGINKDAFESALTLSLIHI